MPLLFTWQPNKVAALPTIQSWPLLNGVSICQTRTADRDIFRTVPKADLHRRIQEVMRQRATIITKMGSKLYCSIAPQRTQIRITIITRQIKPVLRKHLTKIRSCPWICSRIRAEIQTKIVTTFCLHMKTFPPKTTATVICKISRFWFSKAPTSTFKGVMNLIIPLSPLDLTFWLYLRDKPQSMTGLNI